MTDNPILYHGTNSKDYIFLKRDKSLVRVYGRNWTTHPGEAMDFSCLMTKKYGGEMVVLVLPEWYPHNFKDLGERLAVNRGVQCHWYQSTSLDCQKTKDKEQQSVRIYTQSQLEEYVRTYCQDTELENRWLQGYLSMLRESKE